MNLPGTVLAMVQARLEGLPLDARRLLRAASVFGDAFWPGGLASLLGGGAADAASIAAWLAELVSREVIVERAESRFSGEAELAFRHALLREGAYGMLTEADRELGHRLAGTWLSQHGERDPMLLAHHFERGRAFQDAMRAYLRAAEDSLEATDLAAAVDRAERGVACGASGEDLGALRLLEAEAHLWRGDLALAERRGTEAATLFATGSSVWFRAIYQVVVAAGKLGAFDRVEAWVDPASAAKTAPAASSARLTCLSGCATYLTFGGRYEVAEKVLGDIQHTEEGDARAVALMYEARAFHALALGDLGSCLTRLQAALAGFEAAGDRRNACITQANLGFVFAELGDFGGAAEVLRSALEGAERMGLADFSAVAAHNLGHALAYRGCLDEARSLERHAIGVFRRQGDPRLGGLARVYLAKIELLAGDFAAAEREARAAAEELSAIPPVRASAFAVLSRALLHEGRAVEALASAREAFALLESLGRLEEGEALVRLVYAEALAANGALGEALAAITDARDHLLARAAKISEPAFRERFLNCVPDNARTLAGAAHLIRV